MRNESNIRCGRHCALKQQTNSQPVMTSLLRMTNMIAPLPREAVQPECDRGDLTVSMEDIRLTIGNFGIVTRGDHRLSPGGPDHDGKHYVKRPGNSIARSRPGVAHAG
jgi:hypothetical protein